MNVLYVDRTYDISYEAKNCRIPQPRFVHEIEHICEKHHWDKAVPITGQLMGWSLGCLFLFSHEIDPPQDRLLLCLVFSVLLENPILGV